MIPAWQASRRAAPTVRCPPVDKVATPGPSRDVDPVVSGLLLRENGAPTLTDRERQVLRLLADGCSYEEVGQQLFISPETVRTHVAKSQRTLGVRTRTQAVAAALRAGLIT